MRNRTQRLKLGLGAALAAAILAATGVVAAAHLFAAPAELNPCAAKTLNPCAAKTLNPCAAKAANPCGARNPR